MARFLKPAAAAFGIFAGSVFAAYNSGDVPVEFLLRPLIVSAAASAALAAVAVFAGRYSTFCAASTALVLALPGRVTSLVVLAAAATLVASRIVHRPTAFEPVIVGAAVVFAVSGAAFAATQTNLHSEATQEADGGAPIYLILVDGYPRIDVLGDLGYDNTPFIKALTAQGFDHYPDATSTHHTTDATLTLMLGDNWKLPPGFVTIAPPWGHVTLPGRNIGPGGVNDFEAHLIQQSLFAQLAGDLLVDQWRQRVDRSLDTLAATEHERVFAHIAAPHAPYLYAADGSPMGAPDCWPDCALSEARDITDDGLVGTVDWLNRRLIETVDTILDRRPDATIVVFGDHGPRMRGAPTAYSFKPLLLARTPQQPGVFAGEPRPGRVLEAMP